MAVLRVWLVAAGLTGALAGALAGTLAGGMGGPLGATPAMAADAIAPGVAPARDTAPVGEPCPLTSPEHTARLVAPALPEQEKLGEGGHTVAVARVDEPLAVVVALEGPPLPSGVFPVVNIDRAAGPDGGRVSATTGYPDSEVRFSAPGRYELDLTVTLVARSSCGGAKARTVLERRVAVLVAP
ncbi:hypothetical protein [Nitratidesulfovibrio liaohensis]|uniref:Uncharacterized protein n=1 Tax=Nitratidesulfovibrio liaohensis TaxID=2604158 RepID=A0ABY9R7D2_9BACT|nr:hypothetical protein [Nitratidesulfovibrio liaohensis]WMW66540.1 hypothetical protein KPS_001127 [Nitratidesulfovibrio liaohensis]